jgi:hypothetical protein
MKGIKEKREEPMTDEVSTTEFTNPNVKVVYKKIKP